MDYEPSNRELARRLDDLAEMLRGGVSRPEYNEYQRHIESRFADGLRMHGDDIRALQQQVAELRQTVQAAANKSSADWKQFLYAGIVPFGIGILVILATLWTSKGKLDDSWQPGNHRNRCRLRGARRRRHHRKQHHRPPRLHAGQTTRRGQPSSGRGTETSP